MIRHLTILLLLLVLASCAGGDKVRIGVSQCSHDEWREKMNHEMQREAMLHDGVELTILTTSDNSAQQSRDIDSLVALGVDLLIVSPNEAQTVGPAIRRAHDKGIPVILFDPKAEGCGYDAFIGADNREIGISAARYVASRAGAGARVLEIRGLAGSSADQERHQGFISVIEPVASFHGDWLVEGAKKGMAQWLKTHSLDSIDYVFSHNDRMALGAYQAIVETTGSKPTMPFIGVDGLADADSVRASRCGVGMIQEGILEATFLYPTNGDQVLRTGLDILANEPYDTTQTLNTALIDSANAPIMQLQATHLRELDDQMETLNDHFIQFHSRYATQRYALWATITALLLLAGLLVVVWRSWSTKQRLNDRLREDKLELQERLEQLTLLQHRLEEATQAKLSFFTNISHDFRTPLTLITGPVEEAMADIESIPSASKAYGLLGLVRRNALILTRLVNQILDFRKYENGNLQVNDSPVDLASSLRQWCEGFAAAAPRRGLSMSLDILDADKMNVILDAEKTERVVFNLLSNAFKYTPPGGKVKVSLALDGKDIQICISDTGHGIGQEALQHIFDRFYQIDKKHSGSGIGLALVKAFVEIQGGTISVDSREGKGSTFCVKLPYRHADTQGETIAVMPADRVTEEIAGISQQARKDSTAPGDTHHRTALIIDDNPDILAYVSTLLQNDYDVLTAHDGKEGLQMATQQVPDIIICDVMMPMMDGMECCRRLKGQVQTSHIPVVMLTACTQDEQRAEGYECGADSYLSKPFSGDVLSKRLRNLLQNRQRVLEASGAHLLPAGQKLPAIDRDFITRLRDKIEQNLSNPGLSVDDLAAMMALSRVQLYRKVKAMTDSTPTDLLRTARLLRAAALLAQTDKTVAEVAFDCGFSSPSYFSKCYREQYGQTPNAHRDS